MNIVDKLYTEWAWRTKSGIPDINNPEDKAILDSILEQSIKVRTTEEVIKVLQSAGVKDSYTLRAVQNTYNSYNDSQKQNFNRYFRSLKLNDTNLKTIGDVYKDFYDAKASKGMGRGEVMIILGIKDSKSGGTAEKDILVNGQTFEVKEISGKEFSPAKDGDINGTEYNANYNQFKTTFSNSVLEVLEEHVTDEEFKLLKEVQAYTQKNSTRNQKSSYVRALTSVAQILSRALPEAEKEEVNYINVNGGRNIAISADDANQITPGSTINITLGDELQDAKRHIDSLKKHPWIVKPGVHVTQLESILSKFFEGLNGMILFNYKDGLTTPHLFNASDSRNMFFASRVTQGIVQAKLTSEASKDALE